MRKLLAIPIFLLLCSSARAQVVAATCSNTDVQTAINTAVAGQIVTIPAGSCGWTTGSSVTLNKAVTLNGAGIGVTNINLTGSNSFVITKQVGGPTRIQNLTFTATNSKVVPHLVGIGGPWPTGQPVIFQNIGITLSNADFTTIGTAGGVIFSKVTFSGTLGDTLLTCKDTGSTASWTSADTLGSRDTTGFNNTYVEDSTFNGGTVTDADQQCRIVMRHNVGNESGGFNSHGFDSSPSSMRHFEIYNNSFKFPDKTCPGGNSSPSNMSQYIWLRGGTGVVFNNNFDSLNSACWGDKPEIRMSIRGAEDDRPHGISCSAVTYPVEQQLGQNFNGSAYFTDPIWFWGNTSNDGADPGSTVQIAVSAGWAGWNGPTDPCFTTYQTLGYGNTQAQQWSHFFQWGRDAANTAVGVNLCNSGSLGCEVEGAGGTAKPGYAIFTYPHPLVAGLTISPNPLAFGNQGTGTTSAALTETITNTGSSSVVLATPFFVLSGTNAGDMAKVGGTCANGGTITAGSTCTATFTFTPAAGGARTATLTVNLNPAGVFATSTFTGTGTAAPAPAVSVTPNPFSFGTVNVGTSSPTQAFTLTNTGNASLTITSIVSSDGIQFPLSGSSCGGTLAAGATCTWNEQFNPISAGLLSATITLTTNAASSPDVVPISGSGFSPVVSPPPVPAPIIIVAAPPATQPVVSGVTLVGTCAGTGKCAYLMSCSNCSQGTILFLDKVQTAQTYANGTMAFSAKLAAGLHSYSAVNLQ